MISKDDFIHLILGGVRCLWFGGRLGPHYTVQKPFLLTHRDRDRANRGLFAEQSTKWAAIEPNCRHESIRDAGHTEHMDNPDSFNRVLLGFLHGLDRTTTAR